MIRVLVADDDKLARKGIIALMNWSKYGMEVVGDVQNGKIALDFVQAHPVDLVFVDIDMPEMDGIEFMRQCRQIKPDIRFVVLTFYEEYSYARAAIQMECLDYISKAELEMTDGDTVLERIQKRYLSRTPTKPDASLVNEEELDALSAKWMNLEWLFRDRCWNSLLEETKAKNPDLRTLERILIPCLQKIESLTGTSGLSIPRFSDTEKLLEWMTAFRRQCYAQAEKPSCNEFTDTLRAVEFIRRNFCRKIHASEAAKEIGLSRSYFSSRFKKYVGKTFTEFVCELRIDYAEKLLRETTKSVLEIALCCGYDDLYYFNRIFKEDKQCSPGEYRRKARDGREK